MAPITTMPSSLSLQEPFGGWVRADSPILGFECATSDPLRFPSPGFPRDLCDAKVRPLCAPPIATSVQRALRTRASALSLNHTHPRNAVYLDPTDASLLFHPSHSRASSLESIASDEDVDAQEVRDAAYLHIRALYSSRQQSQIYLGAPAEDVPLSPITASPASTPDEPPSSRWSTTSSLLSPPTSPSQPSPSKRKRITSILSRFSLGTTGLLASAVASPEPREMREAYLERDDPPAPVELVLGHSASHS
ncbi:hypothetical protein H0H87_011716, partial [Tephrocybe sp. NHM501043]